MAKKKKGAKKSKYFKKGSKVKSTKAAPFEEDLGEDLEEDTKEPVEEATDEPFGGIAEESAEEDID